MSETPMRFGPDPDEAAERREPVPGPGDVFDPPSKAESVYGDVSPLEQLKAAMATPLVTEPVILKVPTRPGMKIRCHTRFSQEERKAWLARSKGKRSRRRGQEEGETDEMRFACLVIANTCEAVLMDNQEVRDEDGTPLTFRHKMLWDIAGAVEPEQAIRNLFGKDAHVLLASGEIMLGAGFDDDLEDDDDPTVG